MIVTVEDYKKDFKTFARDILTYEVDDRPIRRDRVELVTRNKFWKDLYIKRENEEEDFRSFIRSDIDLLVVTGSVGAGKSTLIRHKIEDLGEYTGVIVDFRSKHDILDDKNVEISKVFKRIIKDAYLLCLKNNFETAIETGQGVYHNLITENYSELFNRAQEKTTLAATYFNIRKCIVIEGLLLLGDQENIQKLITELLPEHADINNMEFRSLLKQKLTRQLIDRMLEQFRWYHLVRLLQRLAQDNKPHLIVFDNFERHNYKKLDKTYLEEIITMLAYLNNKSSVGSGHNQDAIVKVIIAVRDENISRLNVAATNAKKVSHLTIGNLSYTIASDIPKIKVNLNHDLVKTIIHKRLIFLNSFFAKPYPIELTILNELIEEYWLNQRVTEKHDSFTEYEIFELCNGSLRIMLELIIDFSFELIDLIKGSKLNIEAFKKYFSIPFFRSKLIRSFFNQNKGVNALSILINSVKGELEKEYCCLYRILLSYLDKCDNRTQRISVIINDIQEIIDVEQDTILKALFDLYRTESALGELIIIDQIDYIQFYTDISADGVVRLSQKGETFIRAIMLNLEFYSIAADAENEKTLFELDPHAACKVIEKIYNTVQALFRIHMEVWQNEIIPRISSGVNNGDTFGAYVKKYLIKESFHLTRVCSSHLRYIALYATECLKGPEDCRLMLSNSDRQLLSKYNAQNIFTELNETFLSKEVRDVVRDTFDKHNPIRQILGILSAYHNISRELDSYAHRYKP